MIRLRNLAFIAASFALGACAVPSDDWDDDVESAEDALAAKADEHWFYTGALPRLDYAAVTVSLKGHTARASGLLPAGAPIPDLPHVRAKREGQRVRIDVVYPIATANAAIGKSNSRPGDYAFSLLKPYRPDGNAWTRSEGDHFVPWGGFPFIAYNNGIAMHGPITSKDSASAPDQDVWYLRRGQVSGGCNRMLGEHVVELAHLLGRTCERSTRPTARTARVRHRST
jgi:hypothetical protein